MAGSGVSRELTEGGEGAAGEAGGHSVGFGIGGSGGLGRGSGDQAAEMVRGESGLVAGEDQEGFGGGWNGGEAMADGAGHALVPVGVEDYGSGGEIAGGADGIGVRAQDY